MNTIDSIILYIFGLIMSVFAFLLIYFVVSTDDYDCKVKDQVKWWNMSYYLPNECIEDEAF